MYCFFYPTIDTTFAKGYSEAKFQMIQTTWTAERVVQEIGQPLHKYERDEGGESWWYSQDGACSFGDFAWLGRAVVISNNVVVGKIERWFED